MTETGRNFKIFKKINKKDRNGVHKTKNKYNYLLMPRNGPYKFKNKT